MQTEKQQRAEIQAGGCRISLVFAPRPVEGVIEKVRAILSAAYDERVQNDLKGITGSL